LNSLLQAVCTACLLPLTISHVPSLVHELSILDIERWTLESYMLIFWGNKVLSVESIIIRCDI
jgi:hypothetical protein